jgi:hypothetical protein
MMSSNDGKERPATARHLSDLPRSIAPPRDLWPEIEASLAKERTQEASGRGTRLLAPSRAQWVALAAVVSALAVGVWLGRTMLPATTGPAAAGDRGLTMPAGGPAAMQAAYVSDPRYVQQRETMIRSLEAQLQRMPPETQAKVGASLATIRKSIQDIQQALGRDPGNALLQELLVNTYQDEMRVLTAVHEAGDAGEEI